MTQERFGPLPLLLGGNLYILGIHNTRGIPVFTWRPWTMPDGLCQIHCLEQESWATWTNSTPTRAGDQHQPCSDQCVCVASLQGKLLARLPWMTTLCTYCHTLWLGEKCFPRNSFGRGQSEALQDATLVLQDATLSTSSPY